jgi:hypothetical protein
MLLAPFTGTNNVQFEDPNYAGGANRVSLAQAARTSRNWKRSTRPAALTFVRPLRRSAPASSRSLSERSAA